MTKKALWPVIIFLLAPGGLFPADSKYAFQYLWEGFERENLWLIDELYGNAVKDIELSAEYATESKKSMKVTFHGEGLGLITRVDVPSLAGLMEMKLDVLSTRPGARFTFAYSIKDSFDWYEAKSVNLKKGWNRDITVDFTGADFKFGEEQSYERQAVGLDQIKKIFLKFEILRKADIYVDNIRFTGREIGNRANAIPLAKVTAKDTVSQYSLIGKAVVPSWSAEKSAGVLQDRAGKYALQFRDIDNIRKAAFAVNQAIDLSGVSKILVTVENSGTPAVFSMAFQSGEGWTWTETPLFYLSPNIRKSVTINLNAPYFKSERTTWNFHSYLFNKQNIKAFSFLLYGFPKKLISGSIRILDFAFVKGKQFVPEEEKVLPYSAPVYSKKEYAPPRKLELYSFDRTVYQYDKLELTFAIPGDYKNPYDPDEVSCRGIFTSPEGDETEVPAFYYGFLDDNRDETGKGVWKVRFAPDRTGAWKFSLKIKNPAGEALHERTGMEFNVLPAGNKNGFVRARGNRFVFDSGRNYYPVGANLCWVEKWLQEGKENLYLKYLKDFSRSRMNWTRIWNVPWGLILEWTKPRGAGLAQYSQKDAFLFDEFVEYARQKGIYLQLVLNYHRMLDVNYEWDAHPYNKKNGGPMEKPEDFFTDPTARKLFKQRLLYTIARWGYSTSLLAWELFNEVDLTSAYHEKNVRKWHREMGKYIKSVDPFEHLVTTSFARPLSGMETYDLSQIDFSQTHIYTYDFKAALFTIPRHKTEKLDKPHITSEIGGGVEEGAEEEKDKTGIRLHNVLWYSLFSLTPSSAMYWWWDYYIGKNGLYHHFEHLSRLTEELDFKKAKETAVRVETKGISDYFFAPTLDWERPTGSEFRLVNNELTGDGYLSKYFQGPNHSDMMIKPEFAIDFLEDGRMDIMVEQSSYLGARLKVLVDGQEAFSRAFAGIDSTMPAVVNRLFSIPVKKGKRKIRLENGGPDWIKMTYINFVNCVADIEAFGLQDGKCQYIWLKNRSHNAESVLAGRKSAAVPGRIVVDDVLKQKKAKVYYYDTWKNELVKIVNIGHRNRKFVIDYPAVEKDILLVVKKHDTKDEFSLKY